ncbi:MAG: chemotaxis protein CheW [Pseudomonadota bacterium]|jgi:chemotaxis signal transduction protein
MAQYLHVRVEDVALLLPALQVHEVIGLENQGPHADGHMIWRDQTIMAFDLGYVLRRCNAAVPTRAYGVVFSPDDSDAPPVLMAIDEVLGLRNPRREQLQRLPSVKTVAHDWFESIWIDDQLGAQAYCLKTQLSPSLFA